MSTGHAKYDLRFHKFATDRDRIVSAIEAQLFLGLSVSPDRQSFLFTHLATPSNLMLIENFR